MSWDRHSCGFFRGLLARCDTLCAVDIFDTPYWMSKYILHLQMLFLTCSFPTRQTSGSYYYYCALCSENQLKLSVNTKLHLDYLDYWFRYQNNCNVEYCTPSTKYSITFQPDFSKFVLPGYDWDLYFHTDRCIIIYYLLRSGKICMYKPIPSYGAILGPL